MLPLEALGNREPKTELGFLEALIRRPACRLPALFCSWYYCGGCTLKGTAVPALLIVSGPFQGPLPFKKKIEKMRENIHIKDTAQSIFRPIYLGKQLSDQKIIK